VTTEPPAGPPPEPPYQPPTQPPVPYPPSQPPYAPPAYGAPAYGPPPATAADRLRTAWQQRSESDYYFDFWTAFGWTILTCGIYGFYVIYQLVRRSRDHNRRRITLLEAATSVAWEKAQAGGLASELQPSFNQIAAQLAVLQQQSSDFRDPIVWSLLRIVGAVIVDVIVYILLNGDLNVHDRAEGAIEHELSVIYTRLGAPVPSPDPARVNEKHNYVGRIIATLATCGIYSLWWLYDVMTEGNAHFTHNWHWEDALVASAQQIIG